MRYSSKNLIIFLICLGLILINFRSNAQYSTPTSTSVSSDELPSGVYDVLGGGLVLLVVIVSIKRHSSPDFRKFKHEIVKIDGLLQNKNGDILNFKTINNEFSYANNYYLNALNSGRKIQNRLSVKKQYFDNQKETYYKNINETLSLQYKSFKNQFFDNIVNNNTKVSQEILDNKIKPLINDWNSLEESYYNNHFNETGELDQIILTANNINRIRANAFSLLNSYKTY